MRKAPTREELKKSRVLVLRLGRAGIASARFLLRLGVKVSGYDDNPAVLWKPAVQRLKQRGLRLVRKPESARVDFAVVSPGISEDNEKLRLLRSRKIVVLDELDLASRLVRGPVVAVTGTNGKSTTTALIAGMLEQAGKRVFVGGNLAPGKPLSAALNMPEQDFYVVEASSFQLERARWFAPRVAVIMNVAPDHLNRHRRLEKYAECKFRILDRQNDEDYAVLNCDDPIVMRAKERGRAKKLFFSMRRRVRGGCLSKGWFWFEGTRIARVSRLKLPGRHNVQNALAAICAVKILGIRSGPVRGLLADFTGLAHRLELVGRLDGVEFYNNSMCTNPTAGMSSLEAFNRKVVLITGGKEKGLPVNGYVHLVARKAKWAVLMGESSHKLARLLTRVGFRRFDVCQDLREAVGTARKKAGPGDVVLFSPAFASFDQFADFQERGRAFKKEVVRFDQVR